MMQQSGSLGARQVLWTFWKIKEEAYAVTSGLGTKRTWRSSRHMSVVGGRAEVIADFQDDRF
jgi:hypothetical protein